MFLIKKNMADEFGKALLEVFTKRKTNYRKDEVRDLKRFCVLLS